MGGGGHVKVNVKLLELPTGTMPISLSPQLRKGKRKEIFKRAEQYVKEYRQRERDEIRLKREARKCGNYYVPDEPKLAFVIRIRG